jgi:hypothetical protein
MLVSTEIKVLLFVPANPNSKKTDTTNTSFHISVRSMGYVRLDLPPRMRYYTFIFKLFLTRVSDNLYSRFIFLSNVHSYRTRNSNILLIPMHVSGLMTSSFTVTASKLWNVVDSPLHDSLTVYILKKNVEIWLSLSEQ